jgi:hypothetical protein
MPGPSMIPCIGSCPMNYSFLEIITKFQPSYKKTPYICFRNKNLKQSAMPTNHKVHQALINLIIKSIGGGI